MNLNGQEITNVAVIGLGLTGRSCVRFLQSHDVDITLYDTRASLDPAPIQALAPHCPLHLGPLMADALTGHQLLLVSPGIAIDQGAIRAAQQAGVLIWGDVELFAHFVDVPVIGITGSNGKTTVTTLLCDMASRAGVKALAIGNIGLPVLDGLMDKQVELFVLELSSFQLETTHQLKLCSATVLNISDDHMDRYQGLDDYAQAKRRIYAHSNHNVINRQDGLTHAASADDISFGIDKPTRAGDYGLNDGALYCGDLHLIDGDEMAMIGQHNQLNALAAIAIGRQAGLPLESMIDTLRHFSGLEHRCARVATSDGICWLNDSKATNVGATLAALAGLSSQGQLIVIAGGDAKGGDLSPLAKPFAQQVAHLIVIGQDQQLFCDIYPNAQRQDTLEQAVILAASYANAGDTVLLSPSCASIDMFANYMARGQAFIDAVGGLDVE